MKMSKLLILSSIFLRLISLTTSEYDFVSPPFLDCSAVRYEMVDCVSYLTDDSKRTTPEASCCSGFETVLGTDFNCMCEAIKTIAAAGIDFNAERAMALPSACNVSVPPLTSCRSFRLDVHAVSAAPEFAPANSPQQWPWSDAPPPTSPSNPPNSLPMGSRKSATSEPPRSFKTPAPKSSNPPNAVPESSMTSAPKPSRSGATTYSKTSSFIVLIFMMLFA
ncbi:hypothetical protein CJ030_MR7G012509 [Morella rubra]|uniref:Bifunctional inhibitor/plant lipid transfer protein/seed storage helical domain-containing protein n=1 Tax=Morella rubra TaxID=262757 RepID=A0A6A1UHW6_9ROSI|nr:hypothetical protein CJ030_MR0G012574 [Morella rubra]KAB1205461.1 hypothetical protein CJ030_MR7G010598 [Morella rubra]KAB1207447.1 hypothetical protein CJ030_MR7G012509 [Morella rubra]